MSKAPKLFIRQRPGVIIVIIRDMRKCVIYSWIDIAELFQIYKIE